MSETSSVEAALKNLTALEASLDELRKKVEARKAELIRLAQESGEAAYNATVREADQERTDLVESVRSSAEDEAAGVVKQGHDEVDTFDSKAEANKDAVKSLILQILMGEA